MKDEKKLWEICIKIYRQMYKESEPSADFDNLLVTGEAFEEGFFFKYFLDAERQNEIIDKICKKHRCTAYEKQKVSNTVVLGCSPCVSKERWEKESERRKNESKTGICE